MQKFLVNNWWVLAIILLVMITAVVVMLVIANYREKKLFLQVEDQILSEQSQDEQMRLVNQANSPKPKAEVKPAAKSMVTKASATKSAKPAAKKPSTVKPAAKKPSKKD